MPRAPRATHHLANLFPILAGDELQKLAADIKANGQQSPIITDQQGRIVDGRNREAACLRAGIEPKVEHREFKSDHEVLAFVVSANLLRRHLDESQRAMVAAKIASMRQGERTDLEPSANLPKVTKPTVSQADAAEMCKVSPRSVGMAKKVQTLATPKVQQAVTDGKLPVSVAAKVADLPPTEQDRVADAPKPSEVARAAVSEPAPCEECATANGVGATEPGSDDSAADGQPTSTEYADEMAKHTSVEVMERWIALEALLLMDKPISIQHLAEELGVCTRTVKRDLRDFKKMGQPVNEQEITVEDRPLKMYHCKRGAGFMPLFTCNLWERDRKAIEAARAERAK